jgi:SAM-dependent methyltransferase
MVQQAGQQVIGVDRHFFALYVAQQWIAPEAAYVCCEADTALPFPDGTFAAVICSDAFHTFANKVLCLRELRRVVQPQGLLMLVSLRLPSCALDRSGTPLPPERLRALVADLPHRLVSDRAVLARYLRRQGPPLAHSVDIGDLGGDTWLSVVASHRQAVFQDWGPFEEWPHATGPLGVNPLYVETGRDQRGTVQLRRVFPSVSYEQGHAESKAYLPEAVAVAAPVWADVAAGKRTPEVDQLIAQCVVMGLPERYGRRPSA